MADPQGAVDITTLVADIAKNSPLLVALAPFGLWLKSHITKGLVSETALKEYQEKVEETLKDLKKELKEEFEKGLEDKEDYIQAVDKKVNEAVSRVSCVEGELKVINK